MQIHRHECMDTTGNSHVVILTVSVRADYKKSYKIIQEHTFVYCVWCIHSLASVWVPSVVS